MGIEPTAQAWEAWVLPLYDARYSIDSRRVPRGLQTLASCNGYRYAGIARRRRANPITPATPLNNSKAVAGSGTGVKVAVPE
jgi:hypothetical protein